MSEMERDEDDIDQGVSACQADHGMSIESTIGSCLVVYHIDIHDAGEDGNDNDG